MVNSFFWLLQPKSKKIGIRKMSRFIVLYCLVCGDISLKSTSITKTISHLLNCCTSNLGSGSIHFSSSVRSALSINTAQRYWSHPEVWFRLPGGAAHGTRIAQKNAHHWGFESRIPGTLASLESLTCLTMQFLRLSVLACRRDSSIPEWQERIRPKVQFQSLHSSNPKVKERSLRTHKAFPVASPAKALLSTMSIPDFLSLFRLQAFSHFIAMTVFFAWETWQR